MQKFDCDIAIIGGGAAGLCAAITAKNENKNLDVAIFEKLDRVGKKLITTGNGQCNITNKNLNLSFYHGKDKEFCRYAIEKLGNEKIISFFEEVGVFINFEESGKAYPLSYQAGSVVDCLRFAAAEKNVITRCSCGVLEILPKENGFVLKTQGGDFTAKKVIVATGLLSGGEKLGSDSSGLKILKGLGYKAESLSPSIVQIKTKEDTPKKLKGIKIDAKVSLVDCKRTVAENFGEVLFTDYGLSGPAAMQVSRLIGKGDKIYTVSLDLLPQFTLSEIEEMLLKRCKNLKNRSLEEFLTGMLNKRLGQTILKECGISLSEKPTDAEDKIKEIAKKIKAFDFTSNSTAGFLNSQVTAGGLATNQFDNKTMQSKLHKGLYAVGEILDIDGDCGGYNLAFAWTSAMLAAKDAVNQIGDK
jgi:predicted Rossmann fold flavoprotein